MLRWRFGGEGSGSATAMIGSYKEPARQEP
jgi:hypothetical protein